MLEGVLHHCGAHHCGAHHERAHYYGPRTSLLRRMSRRRTSVAMALSDCQARDARTSRAQERGAALSDQHLQPVPCTYGPPSPCPQLFPMCEGAAVAPPRQHLISTVLRGWPSLALAHTDPRDGASSHTTDSRHMDSSRTAPDAPHAPAHRAHARRARTRIRRTSRRPRSGRGQAEVRPRSGRGQAEVRPRCRRCASSPPCARSRLAGWPPPDALNSADGRRRAWRNAP